MNSLSGQHAILHPRDEFDRVKHLSLRLDGEAILVGDRVIALDGHLALEPIGSVPAATLARVAQRYHRLTGLGRTPQLAALLFDATGNPRYLCHYFPLIEITRQTRQQSLFTLVGRLAAHAQIDVRLIDEHGVEQNASLARSARWVIAATILEALWGRGDLLGCFLKHRRLIRLYTNEEAFARHSGLRGSRYHYGRHSIDLSLSEVYAGFFTHLPGVSPLLQGLARMLDDIDARSGRAGVANGMLPGLNRRDGVLTTPKARDLFLAGKWLERERYQAQRNRYFPEGETVPIGAPHLFSDDRTFMAGYFELFFRIPHYFANQNPSLYTAFMILLGQDPRRFRAYDYLRYVNESQVAYDAGTHLPPAGIRGSLGWRCR